MKYEGDELELFREARNWKRYFADELKPFIHGDVLDVGCGNGVNAEYLLNPHVRSWTFLEPDAELIAQVDSNITAPLLLGGERLTGTTADLNGRAFDTILYIDVVEHIRDARNEIERAFGMLRPGGHLIILAPAFNSLYSPFDQAIGHHRRYVKGTLKRDSPASAVFIQLRYLDSVGLLLSLGNTLFLHRSMPTVSQIRFWDRIIVPLSRLMDRIALHSFGRTLIGVMRKQAG